MATESGTIDIERQSTEEIQSTIGAVKKMLLIGAVFVVVGYALILGALVLEFTSFHPLIEQFFTEHTAHSIAGGGADRAGNAALNSTLTEIHQFPSTLLWMKLGGIGHILVGIFISLAAIIRVLSIMPHRLSYEMERTQG